MSTRVDVHADPPATICVPFLLFSHTQVTPPGSRVVRPTCPAPSRRISGMHTSHVRQVRTYSYTLRHLVPLPSGVACHDVKSKLPPTPPVIGHPGTASRHLNGPLPGVQTGKKASVDTSTVEVPFSRLLGQLGKEITLACACARPLWLRATPGGLRARNGAAGRDRLPWLRNRPLFGGRRAEAPSSREHLRRAERRWLRRRWGG